MNEIAADESIALAKIRRACEELSDLKYFLAELLGMESEDKSVILKRIREKLQEVTEEKKPWKEYVYDGHTEKMQVWTTDDLGVIKIQDVPGEEIMERFPGESTFIKPGVTVTEK